MVAGYQSARDTVLPICVGAESGRPGKSHAGLPAPFRPTCFRSDLKGAAYVFWRTAASGLFPFRRAALRYQGHGILYLQTSLSHVGADSGRHDWRPWAIRRLG